MAQCSSAEPHGSCLAGETGGSMLHGVFSASCDAHEADCSLTLRAKCRKVQFQPARCHPTSPRPVVATYNPLCRLRHIVLRSRGRVSDWRSSSRGSALGDGGGELAWAGTAREAQHDSPALLLPTALADGLTVTWAQPEVGTQPPAAPASQACGPRAADRTKSRGGGPALRQREQAGRAELAGENNEQRGREKLARGATVALLDRPSCGGSVLKSPYWAWNPGARRGLDGVSERVRIPRCRHTLMLPTRSRE